MPTVVFYISGHGFGHASRQIEVVKALVNRRSDLSVVIRSPVPRWFFNQELGGCADAQSVDTDTGVVQIDSLTVDASASVQRAWSFHKQLDERAAAEALALIACRATLVVGDIPPLAFVAAARAEIQATAVGNFTWDWIYAGYVDEIKQAPMLVPVLGNAYATATLAWRLPLHGGFDTCRRVVNVPLVARHSKRDPHSVRHLLGLPAHVPLALFSFGRYGIGTIDWKVVERLAGYKVIVTVGPGSPKLAIPATTGTILSVDEKNLSRLGLHYEDLVAAVDVVVTKPGYGIISECAANDTAMLYTSRGRFPEYDVLIAGMPRLIRCSFITQRELFRGHWQPHLDATLAMPRPPTPETNGAEVVADGIARML